MESSIKQNKREKSDAISFLTLAGLIKRAVRTGWQMKNVANPESVSDHMYRMGLMAFLLPKFGRDGEPPIDRDRVMKMALVHDLAEAIVGDITPHCGISREEKLAKEQNAMDKICETLSVDTAEEIMELWNEYNSQQTPVAKITKDFDRLEMILQAYEYESEQSRPGELQDFFGSTEGKFSSDLVKNWVEDLKTRRRSSLLKD